MGIKGSEQACVTPNNQMDELTLSDVWILLWRKKLLIVLVTLMGVVGALPYYFLTPPLYSASMVIIPPSIATMGGVVRELNEHSARQSNNIFDQASELSESVMGILKRNLMSQADRQQRQVMEGKSISLSITEDRQRCSKVSQSFAQSGCNSIVVAATGPSPSSLKEQLETSVQRAAGQSAREANKFLGSLDIKTRLEPTDLYQIDTPATASQKPISPNKPKILGIGATLGAMLGVLVVVGLGYRAKRKALVTLDRGD